MFRAITSWRSYAGLNSNSVHGNSNATLQRQVESAASCEVLVVHVARVGSSWPFTSFSLARYWTSVQSIHCTR